MPLSHSLPLRKQRFDNKECRGFFAGILPEESKREIIARNLGISPKNDFSMLERIGGECAGAVSILPIPGEPPPPTYRQISELELENIFSERHGRRLTETQLESRQVMSGVQHKLVLRKMNGVYSLPLMGAPGTELIKRSTGRYKDLAANELFCLRIFNALSLGSPSASVIGGSNGLLDVMRYDRVIGTSGNISRLHQEDFCQATGRIVARKYQRSGGPGLGDIAEVLRRFSVNPAEDIRRLIAAALANVCVGNMDAHAKNFSILYGDDGPRLAPFYDIVSTEAYDRLDVELSMRFGHTNDPHSITREDFGRLARDLKVGTGAVDAEAERMVETLGANIGGLVADTEKLTGPTAMLQRIERTVRSRLAVISRATIKN